MVGTTLGTLKKRPGCPYLKYGHYPYLYEMEGDLVFTIYDGSNELDLIIQKDDSNYAKIEVTSSGATTLTTVGSKSNFEIATGGSGDIILDAEGSIKLESSTDVIINAPTKLYSTLEVSGTVTFDGAVNHGGNMLIGGTLKVSGNSTLNGTLDAVGNATLGGTLVASGNTTLHGTGTIVGNVDLGGTLDISGNTVMHGNGTIIGNDTVGGTLTVSGNTVLNGLGLIVGNTIIGGTADISGATTLHNTADVVGNTTVGGTFRVSGNSTLNGTFDAVGNTTLGGTLVASGDTTLHGTGTVVGNVDLGGTLDVSGNSTLHGTGTIIGNAVLGGTLNVSGTSTLHGNATLGGTVNVSGTSALHGAVTVNGNLATGSGIKITTQGLHLSATTLTSGTDAIDNTISYIALDATSVGEDFKVSGLTPAAGKWTVITMTEASTSCQVCVSTGATVDGSNEILTFDAAAETVVMLGVSATRFVIVENIGSVGTAGA